MPCILPHSINMQLILTVQKLNLKNSNNNNNNGIKWGREFEVHLQSGVGYGAQGES